jgi:hypothetical protein
MNLKISILKQIIIILIATILIIVKKHIKHIQINFIKVTDPIVLMNSN